MEKPVWAVVANGSRARVLEQHSTKPDHWTEKECWVHPQSRVHGAGAGAAHGPAAHVPRGGPQEHERRAFAQQLAQLLGSAVGEHRVGRLVVFASNPFLGELLAHLDGACRKRMADSHALDLTGLGMHELTQRLHSEFHL